MRHSQQSPGVKVALAHSASVQFWPVFFFVLFKVGSVIFGFFLFPSPPVLLSRLVLLCVSFHPVLFFFVSGFSSVSSMPKELVSREGVCCNIGGDLEGLGCSK